ncbi:MAG: RHS repeat-associated core domain-containing protein [Candidatus Symbiothrix sp.]|jgi:RHS repeat-associated protein|nr:RHS repeat-associated core domain-containing protein [Candidatus Symbiothrix sp.]
MTAGGEKQDRQPYIYGNKELDEMNGLNLYDFLARGYDPAIGRFMSIDPLAEKYYWISPYAYCANNPVNAIDPTGMYIVLKNIFRTNNSGNYDSKTGSVSVTTQSVLKDYMKTTDGKNFFGQFAKKGDVIGGYTFTEDEKFSDKTLTLKDYSFEEGYDSNLPLNLEGAINSDESGTTVRIYSYGESKTDVGETLTHETQLHGYDVGNAMKGKKTTTEKQDHTALKSKDKKHKGYQKYDSTRKELETIDPAYKDSFKKEEDKAKNIY